MADNDLLPSQTVLEECPARALTFLRGISQNPIIRALLAEAGYKDDDNRLGWKRLLAASGYTAEPTPPLTGSAAFDAMVALDNWDEDGFRRVRAALNHLHPEQAKFVFAGELAAATGPAAVVSVATLLTRFDELENSKTRKATRTQDRAALDTLAKRGITKAERDRLQQLVDTAQGVQEPVAPAVTGTPSAEQRRAALGELYAWYKDWSETARSVVKKRAYLITLGLAKRKPPTKNTPPE